MAGLGTPFCLCSSGPIWGPASTQLYLRRGVMSSSSLTGAGEASVPAPEPAEGMTACCGVASNTEDPLDPAVMRWAATGVDATAAPAEPTAAAGAGATPDAPAVSGAAGTPTDSAVVRALAELGLEGLGGFLAPGAGCPVRGDTVMAARL